MQIDRMPHNLLNFRKPSKSSIFQSKTDNFISSIEIMSVSIYLLGWSALWSKAVFGASVAITFTTSQMPTL